MISGLDQLQKWIAESKHIVFFGGAGVSTESGIPDFRSEDGLYRLQYPYPPETILSHTFYRKEPEVFFRFYREKILHPEAKPNAAHKKLAELEAAGKLSAIITQNIDGLHQAAGSRCVYELHGSVLRNYCEKCHRAFSEETILHASGIPKCPCGGTIKPDVVLYEESLDQKTLTGAANAISNADLLIVAGTSLAVYPAAGLLNFYTGSRLVLINKSATPADHRADLILHAPVGEVLGAMQI